MKISLKFAFLNTFTQNHLTIRDSRMIKTVTCCSLNLRNRCSVYPFADLARLINRGASYSAGVEFRNK